MAFGYNYNMVFLPEFSAHSFLLFVDNPAGSTKLRDYSSGKEKVVGAPTVQYVNRTTVLNSTRFKYDAHKTTDCSYWANITRYHNKLHLTLESPSNSKNISLNESSVDHVCGSCQDVETNNSIGSTSDQKNNMESILQQSSTFPNWYARWKPLMEFSGSHMPNPEDKIMRVLELWHALVPDGWQRGHDSQLMGTRYRRGDINHPHPGEHTIEHEILVKHFDQVDFFGYKLIDGINAMPFTQDAGGGRQGNVEADIFVLLKKGDRYVMAVCEVKAQSNNPWFALVENMRQIKLLQLSPNARALFGRRNPGLALPKNIPLMGCVIAPQDFYMHAGQKSNSRLHAERLIQQFCSVTGLPVCLATWQPQERRVVALSSEHGRAYDPLQQDEFVLGVPASLVRASYNAAPGNEIATGKFASSASSAALVANTFGFFLDRPHALPALPGSQSMGWPALSLQLEMEVRFPWSGGRHPWLDVLITTASALIGIESKRFEPFRAHPSAQFSDAYWRPVWGDNMTGYEQVRDNLRDASVVFRYLDAAQLVKHAFALRTAVHAGRATDGRRPVLFYLFAEPLSWPDKRPISPETLQAHRDEIAVFAKAVSGAEVTFLWCSYRDLLIDWMEGADESVRLHAKAISERFYMALHK